MARKTAKPTLHADGVWGSRLQREGSFPKTLVWRPLIILVFVAGITDDFILGLGILRTYDASLCSRAFRPGVDNPVIPDSTGEW